MDNETTTLQGLTALFMDYTVHADKIGTSLRAKYSNIINFRKII